MVQTSAKNKIVHMKVDGTNFVLSAGTSDVNSDVLDLTLHGNPESVLFIMNVGVMASGSSVTMKAAHSDNGTDFEDIEASSQVTTADTDDDKLMALEISIPLKRYLRIPTVRGDGGNSTIEGLFAIMGGVRTEPVTQAVTAGQFVRQPKVLASPKSGTA